jgi:hypothetical protein
MIKKSGKFIVGILIIMVAIVVIKTLSTKYNIPFISTLSNKV